jgi:hypothetical protein
VPLILFAPNNRNLSRHTQPCDKTRLSCRHSVHTCIRCEFGCLSAYSSSTSLLRLSSIEDTPSLCLAASQAISRSIISTRTRISATLNTSAFTLEYSTHFNYGTVAASPTYVNLLTVAGKSQNVAEEASRTKEEPTTGHHIHRSLL